MTNNQSFDLSALTRPSGAFAMLALDQRETMRAMFAERQQAPVSDEQIVEFKLSALRTLSPLASAVLIDRDFAWNRAVQESVTAPNCSLIAAADRFYASGDEIVARAEIDDRIAPAELREQGAKALKLLVIWRPDESPEARVAMVDQFVSRCRQAGLISIIEPVSRQARDGRATDTQKGILAAARELGDRGQDLYKSEVPLHAQGEENDIRRQCAELTRLIRSPWVVLSSGVLPDRFPMAVRWACQEGARGFLAGRAIWKNAIAAADPLTALQTDSRDRLKRLCDVVDEAVAPATA
ncbi:aldolase [Mesorhizobium sp. WSM3876]|uniref:aldolase n=1 Tax=Mesorhizobium sp. WSM3876 TaxID=422277 RepID=UPI000BB058A5|nr:aldolase [Mesorhizobium sp. WSM3876]PBB84448.1 aldolase [Mesorhizobium sp. WSM3876]